MEIDVQEAKNLIATFNLSVVRCVLFYASLRSFLVFDGRGGESLESLHSRLSPPRPNVKPFQNREKN